MHAYIHTYMHTYMHTYTTLMDSDIIKPKRYNKQKKTINKASGSKDTMMINNYKGAWVIKDD